MDAGPGIVQKTGGGAWQEIGGYRQQSRAFVPRYDCSARKRSIFSTYRFMANLRSSPLAFI